MNGWLGHLGADGRPRLKLKIIGPNADQEFEAVIDTGFTGFLHMPLLDAIPLGVILQGTAAVNIADGSSVTVLLTTFEVEVDGDKRPGSIMLDMGSNLVLIGMEFLKIFDRFLTVDVISGPYMIERSKLQKLVNERAN